MELLLTSWFCRPVVTVSVVAVVVDDDDDSDSDPVSDVVSCWWWFWLEAMSVPSRSSTGKARHQSPLRAQFKIYKSFFHACTCSHS